MSPLLRTSGLGKRYGSTTVLHDVSLQIQRGEVHALLGANGAGKSTFCKIVAGLVRPTAGSMQVMGATYRPGNKSVAEMKGVQMVQQELNLIRTLSVAENLFFGHFPRSAGIIRHAKLRRMAIDRLKQFGLPDVHPDTPVSSLGVGTQQMLEIAKTLARDCKLLILDEPTAALSGEETERLFDQLRDLRNRGIGMIYISHRLDEILQIADRYSVLRDGRLIDTRDVADATTDQMVDQMTGESESFRASPHRSHRGDEVALRVHRLSTTVVKDVSFELHRGERLGVAGLVGSGRTELLRAIFGADRARSGQVDLPGNTRPRLFRHPRQAVRNGIAMVTEDRKDNGLLLRESVRANTTLCALWQRFSYLSILRRREENRITEQLNDRMETRCRSPEQAVHSLSGGNQQKVAIAKWLVRDANVFLFDEPTRGIDIQARRRIYHLLEDLSRRGKASVIVSSDTEELFEVCDRILVISNGRLVDQFQRDQFDRDRVARACFAGYAS